MIRLILIAIFSSLVVSSCATRQSEKTTNKSEKTTNILGTWAWDVESNHLGEFSGADFWWEQVSKTKRNLVPLNGAKAAIVQGQKFESIDSNYVRRVALSQKKIAGGALQPGAIVVFRTVQGKAGKLQVLGYKALHDLDFPEATSLTEEWKQSALNHPNTDQYHLQVRWTLLE